MGYETERYYVYKGNDYYDNIAYNDFYDALSVAEDNNCDEIEIHAWITHESYNNCEPADYQKVVWRKGEY